ncbi:hypothetical protein AB205_0038930 [Aquarana catesbeiana]|uniref:Ig-like domain-containing protein n=1 Tax=Aquarana catesbeiana TaxID=8400 RepID=A0A2G9REC5_AQUCT|nr:hypothetical protein AB205_0038930 [Aquarana catesbeiana]
MPILENTEANLQYKISQYFSPSDLSVTWHKKEKNGNMTHLPKYSSKYKPNTSISQVQPDNTYSCTTSLLITPTLPDDQGSEFICRVEHPSLGTPIERSTGPLQVCDFPWRPEVTELSNPVLLFGRLVTVECDISNFFPKNLTVMWFVKERGSQGYVPVDLMKPYKSVISQLQYSDSGYSCTASVEFNPSSFSSHHGVMFMCKVKHPSLEHPIERITKPLFITLAPVVTDSVKLNPCESEFVLCSVRLEKFFPKNINLTWTFGENKNILYTPKKTLLVDDKVESFGVISECKIPWNQLKFPVRVTWEHESMAEPQSEELLGPDFPWCPQIEALDTPYLILNTECKIQCRISGYFPKDLTVNWFKEEEESRQPVPVTNGIKIPQPQRQPDNTYSCTASLYFTPTQMDHRLVFICKVRHPSLKEPKEERIGPLKIVELLGVPHIDSLDTSMLNGKYKIECRISGYSPKGLKVTWMKKSKRKYECVTKDHKYNIPDIVHERQSDNTFSCTASLSYKPKNEGSEFICRVEHPSLDQPIEKHIRPLQLQQQLPDTSE